MKTLQILPFKGKVILLLAVIALTTSAFLHKQEKPVATLNDLTFTLSPKYSADYLAWEASEDAVSWQIEIMKKEDPSSDLSNYLTVLQFEQTKNYYKVDELFIEDPDIIIRVTSKDARERTLETGDWNLGLCPPPGCVSWTDVCTWKCNGPDYAFEINLIENSNGPQQQQKLQLDYTEQSFNPSTGVSTPYYQFIKPSDWANFVQNPGPCYPYISDPDWVNNNRVTFNNVSLSQGFYDISGTPLAGTVYGVPKGLCNFGPPRTTPVLVFSSGCGSTMDLIIDVFEAQSTLPSYSGPDLECFPTSTPNIVPTLPDTSGVVGDPVTPDSFHVSFTWHWCPAWCPTAECCAPVIEPGQPFDDIFDLFTTHDPSYPNYIAPEPPFQVFDVEEFSEFHIYRLDKAEDPVTINADDVYLVDGTISYPDLSHLENGLYKIVTFFDNGHHMPRFFEYSNDVNPPTVPIPMSEQLEVSIYPVPILTNEFSMDFTAHADMQFTYRLTTSSGAVLYANNFSLVKDQTITVPIAIQEQLEPFTLLINSFYFDDNSSKVLQTIKT
ncbi:MAG: hypothetical protein AAGG75_21795 [Bacteroidota bacterium]